MDDRTCSAPNCLAPITPRSARGLCPKHYQRLLRTGEAIRTCETCELEVARNRRFCSDECKPPCSVQGCGQPVRKREWCAAHYSQHRRTGEPPAPFAWKWAAKEPCLTCGEPAAYGYRQFCSGACRAYWLENGLPGTAPCVNCRTPIDLSQKGKGGRRVNRNIRLCRRCRNDLRKHGMSVTELAARDGLSCGICNEPVDMTARAPSAGCASVDHIVPKALGGTNDPGNLQLAHLGCNVRKGHRMAG